MKVKKLNKELLNLYYTKDKKVYCQIVDDKTYVSDSYRIWILKSDEFMLNPINLKTITLTTFLDDTGYIDGVKTNNMKQLDKFTGVYIENQEQNIKCLINQKYLDIFENYTLKIKAPDRPVLVYEQGELTGLVLPMREY